MRKSFILACVFIFSVTSQAKVTKEEITSLSVKLKGGEYTGSNDGKHCSVSVIDNGGNGSAYSVRVTPSEGSQNLLADFSVTVNQEGQISDMGADADSIGINFVQDLALVRRPDGNLYVRISNQVVDETAVGRCTISTR